MEKFLMMGLERQKQTMAFTKKHPVCFLITITILLLVQQNSN
jgi:hypothetical protein